MRQRPRGRHFAVTVVAAVSGIAIPSAALAPTVSVKARTFKGMPAVGALFSYSRGTGLGAHFCTASVVHSPNRDLVLTAAHCVSNVPAGRIAFVPGYRDGNTPYGIWLVTRVVVDKKWKTSADPDDDFAFLVVTQHGGSPVEKVTGAEHLGIDQPARQMVRVTGYPDGAAAPIHCENVVRTFSPTQLVFDCGGFTDGTSGSPLVAHFSRSTGLGAVMGVIGGYQQGGDTAAVSYAARFSAALAALYAIAVSES